MNGPAPRRALGQSGRPADAFVGRRDELAVISSYVDAIVSGSPWVIWVEGDAGSGKTALVRQALSGGAMMLPGSVAIVNGTFEASERGRALGTMGGAAAVAGALGPTIGGVLTAISWRLVLLVNVPLAVVCIVATLASVPASKQRARGSRIDILGAVLLCVAIVGLVYGLTETQDEGFFSPEVLGALVLAVIARSPECRPPLNRPGAPSALPPFTPSSIPSTSSACTT